MHEAARRAVVLLVYAALAASALVATGCARANGDLLLVTVSGLRADAVGSARCPQLTALATGDACFGGTVLTPYPETLPALAALMAGADPDRIDATEPDLLRVGPARRQLAQILRDEGYDTAAFIGDGEVSALAGVLRGYDDYLGPNWPVPNTPIADRGEQSRVRPRRGGRIGARELADAVGAYLRARSSSRTPRMIWVHLGGPSAAAQGADPRAAYDRALAELDEAVGYLGEVLETYGLGQHTLMVVAGLHGEGLGDGGEVRHGLTLSPAVVEVPIIARGPGAEDLRPPRSLSGLRSALLPLLRVADPALAEAGPALALTLLPRRLYGWSARARVESDAGTLSLDPAPLWSPAEGEVVSGPEALSAAPEELRQRLADAGFDQADAAAPTAPPRADLLEALARLHRADASVSLGDALTRLGRLAASEPRAVSLWRMQLDTLRRAGALEDARVDSVLAGLRGAVEGCEACRFDLLRALVTAGRREEALDLAEQLAASRPSAGEKIALAEAYEDLAATDLAVEVLDDLLSGDDDAPELAEWMGDLLQGAGNSYRAREAYEAALASSRAARPELEAKLADAFAALGQGDQALRHYAAALEADPGYRYPHARAAEVLLARGDRGRAADAVAKSLAPTGDEVQDALARARALGAQGLTESAAVELDQALAEHPGHPGLSRELALIYLAAGDAERALELLEQGLATSPRNGRLVFDTARAAAAASRPERALELLQRLAPLAGPALTAAVRAEEVFRGKDPRLEQFAGSFRGTRTKPSAGQAQGKP